MSQTPKYEIIKQKILNDITSQKLAPGNELPSETELMEEFQVSRITVRRALEELYQEGYIEKKRGKRAIVHAGTRMQELTTISSYTEEILRHGMTPSRKVLHAEIRLCSSQEQEDLHLDKADPVFTLERIVYADKQPYCYTVTTVPYHLFRNIDTYDFTQQSLYDLIENKYNIKITTSTLKLKAVAADKKTASYLDVDPGYPLLHSAAITYGNYQGEEIPIETFQSYYLTDHFEYSLVQSR